MSHVEEVAGGRTVRHLGFTRWLGVAIVGTLAAGSVFASGYLVGSGSDDPTTPTVDRQASLPVLPAEADADADAADDADDAAPSRRAGPPTRRVTVESGQSLWQIAATYAPGKNPQAVVAKIVRLNSLGSPDSLEIGQKLVVPKYKGTAPAAQVLKTQPARATDQAVAIPTGLVVPTIGLEKPLINLDVVGGALQVPQRWNDVGWWQAGPRPGERGAAVFVGHVDSPTGPAVFYGLSGLREGDLIRVKRADSTTATFRVFESVLYLRSEFPSKQVYREDGPPILNLVTCGGSYDAEAGEYTENLVVSARLVTKAKG
jgi:LysM repeat protein